jgi:hypothetical protein
MEYQNKKQIKRVYMTHKRKLQLLHAKILFGVVMLAVIVIGAVGTYTQNSMASDIPDLNKREVSNPETIDQMIDRIAKEENFQWVSFFKKLVYCESRYDQYAINNNGAYGVDRGLLQINTKYHPEVSNEQAFDLDFSIRWSMRRIQNGFQSEWMCNKWVLKGKW